MPPPLLPRGRRRHGHHRSRGGTLRRSISAATRPLRGRVTKYHTQPDGKRGAPAVRSWWLFGQTVRGNDKPSQEHYAPDGITVIKQWWLIRSGTMMVPHRDNDLPAFIEYDPTTKNIIEEHWFINGVPARADPSKPTSIFYTALGDEWDRKYATPLKFVQKNIPTDPIDGYIMQLNDYLRSQLTKDITSLAGLLELANEYMATHPTKDGGKDLRTMFPFPRSYFLAKTGDVATVQIRSVLDVIFVQHAAQQQLQIKNLPASLLDAALMQNLDGLAADILTKLLEGLDPSDAEAMNAIRAYLEPKNLRRNPSSAYLEPYLRRKRAGISESTYSLLDTAYNMLVNDVGLDYMRNYRALLDMHPINKERHQTSDGVPRITLLIDAHGADLFTGTTGTPSSEKPQKFHFEGFDGDEPGAGKLSVHFFGLGQCDVETYDFGDGSTADKWRRMIWSDAIPHDPDVDEMMVKLRPKLHEMYVGRHALKHRLSGYDVPRQVNDGEGGKTPWQDRSYSCNDPAERQPNFAPGIVQIVQSFNNPKYDKFVGATLFSTALASPNVDDAARTMVNQWYKDNLLTDGMIKRLRLNKILKLCRAMGYKDVNVFDKACRSMVGDAPTKKKLRAVNASIKDADFRRRQVAEVRRLEDRWPPALPSPDDEEAAAEEKVDDDEDITDVWSKLAVQQRRRHSSSAAAAAEEGSSISSSSSGVRTPSPTGGGTQKRRRCTATATTKKKSKSRRRSGG